MACTAAERKQAAQSYLPEVADGWCMLATFATKLRGLAIELGRGTKLSAQRIGDTGVMRHDSLVFRSETGDHVSADANVLHHTWRGRLNRAASDHGEPTSVTSHHFS